MFQNRKYGFPSQIIKSTQNHSLKQITQHISVGSIMILRLAPNIPNIQVSSYIKSVGEKKNKMIDFINFLLKFHHFHLVRKVFFGPNPLMALWFAFDWYTTAFKRP